MSTQELQEFCETHNVEILFYFDVSADAYRLRMRRENAEVTDILRKEFPLSSADWLFFVRAKLYGMLGKIKRGELK